MGISMDAARERAARQWESLTIADDFVFTKVMQEEPICRELLEAVLGVPIERVEYVGHHETIRVSPEHKGVELDAYVRDGKGTVYNIEMQKADTHELTQRSRYYHSMMALDLVGKGKPYGDMGHSYVIFICSFDPFKRNRRVYWFETRDVHDESLALKDGLHTIFLAATAPRQSTADARVNELLDYVSRGEVSGEFSQRLEDAVARVRANSDWRDGYMWQYVRDTLNKEQGREEGRAEGEGLFPRLAAVLYEEGRGEDVRRAATDKEFRSRLYEEYHIA